MVAGADLMLFKQPFGSNYQDSAILLSHQFSQQAVIVDDVEFVVVAGG